jgi:hypothetical protein
MPKYFIHIGPHKTGSTYLQAAFRALRPQLLERGILYPEFGQGPDKLSHDKLAEKLRANDYAGLSDEFGSVNDSRYETVLISAEDLSDIRSDGIAHLKSLLGGAQARVVFYCRRWSELLPSGWQELIKHGETTTFPEFLSSHMVNAFGSHVMNYGHTLARYAEHFGLPNISLVSYSNIVDSGGDLLINFCRNFLAWPDPPVPSLGRVNVSLGPVEVEVIRALNVIDRAHGGKQSSHIFRAFRQAKPTLDLTDLLAAIEGHVVRLRVNEGLGALHYLHTELVRQFGGLLTEPRTGPQLFAPKVSDIPYIRQDYLLGSGPAAALLDVYERISQSG